MVTSMSKKVPHQIACAERKAPSPEAEVTIIRLPYSRGAFAVCRLKKMFTELNDRVSRATLSGENELRITADFLAQIRRELDRLL